MEAAGIDPATVADGTFDGSDLTGLDNAIWHVFGNCVKNPQAPGLLTALTHLVANRDRHLALEEAKAEAKAARDAAKAERMAAHDARKAEHAGEHGNGHAGEHGNGHGPHS
jgi:hypothetical protein